VAALSHRGLPSFWLLLRVKGMGVSDESKACAALVLVRRGRGVVPVKPSSLR